MRQDLARLETEQRNMDTVDIDLMSTAEIVDVINKEDQTVAFKIAEEKEAIIKLTDAYIKTIEDGGRVFYIGAGTSGRLGFIDAAELVPTYGIPEGLVEGIMAGGLPAMRRAKEFAEDHADEGVNDLKERNFSDKDLLIGVAASGRTPYVKQAMKYAKEIGAKTGSISCVSNAEISELADYPIEIVTGQEVVLGSTRMKAGTAEKLTLNLISTTAFIRLGHTYKNLLIADKGHPTTEKAYYRQIRAIAQETNKDDEYVKKIFDENDQNAKLTVCIIKTGFTPEKAQELLDKYGGRLRYALKTIGIE
ncbi:MAG: N-acetylmuramic acid 6-phosphate etherase [Erysipelotrichaceae bacterium]|nr:N-acetylmuramic acid 6-phosphate etherase [Erysipelotrichaceae bacterium]